MSIMVFVKKMNTRNQANIKTFITDEENVDDVFSTLESNQAIF